ncbi:MAG: arginine 2,3-aminomutase [Zetaproteobacteria bacterium]|nr:arginine 2,3-aminomutase [Pseudobdellovibrionaceae bacterium]
MSFTQFASQMFGVDKSKFKSWLWQMNNQIRDKKSCEKYFKLSPDEQEGFDKLNEIFNFGCSPYYAALIKKVEKESPKRAKSLRSQVLPHIQEAFDNEGVKDPLDEVLHSPVKEVVHLYPDRVAFCVAMLCSVYCRFCYRKRRDDEHIGLHYNRKIIANGVKYIAETPAIKDVLITGGDPFVASDEAIDYLLSQLRAIPHVEIIRFGTRVPVTMPYRITDDLCSVLKKYHPIWLNTHFNCVEELTDDACSSLKLLADAGIPIGNQSVLLKDVNDSYDAMKALCSKLIVNRVRPYYLFYPHLIAGTKHLRVPYKLGLDIIRKLRGKISGYAIPTYVIDTPSGKVPLYHNHILGEDKEDLLLEDLNQEIWREKKALKLS